MSDDHITNPENVTASAESGDAITAAASPRPWRVADIDRESRDNHIATCFSQQGHSIIYATHPLSPADLVHECVHAAKAMLGRLGIDDEEAEAYTIEYIFKKLSSPSSSAPPEPSGGNSTVDSNKNGKQP